MKRIKQLLSVGFILTVFVAGFGAAQAQLRTESNTVTTRIGNPSSGGIAACPIPGGPINCGSKNVPVRDPQGNLCGHCGVGYEAFMSYCTYEGINYAMDIGGKDFTPVLLPSVDGKVIQWSFVDETNRSANQAIQLYSGTNTTTGEKYWIQFHHSAPGSGNKGTHASGAQGATVCGDGCNMGHIHVEFAKIDPSGRNMWQDAPTYFCR